MNRQILVSVAYIACRLIAGKKITSLYDTGEAKEIDVKKILDAEFIREFDEKHKAGHTRGRMYEYKPSTGHPIEIFIDKRNFILHIKGSAAYFIGNVQKNNICFYNHKEASHFNYEIKAWSGESDKAAAPRRAPALSANVNAGLF